MLIYSNIQENNTKITWTFLTSKSLYVGRSATNIKQAARGGGSLGGKNCETLVQKDV
jgi:hypothetical protein